MLTFVVQALSGLNFDKFKEAVKGYTFAITKPPRDEMAFQQVLSLPNLTAPFFESS